MIHTKLRNRHTKVVKTVVSTIFPRVCNKQTHFTGNIKDTRNCQEKVKKIIHLKPNQLVPSIYIMKELCFFSLDQ